MASHKRLSLADIAKEEQNTPAPVAAPGAPIRTIASTTVPARDEPRRALGAQPVRNPKSDFVKVSITLPPDMHDALQELSHGRRKRKERYMVSDLVREALAAWLPDQKQ
jgi:hypothetical protein